MQDNNKHLNGYVEEKDDIKADVDTEQTEQVADVYVDTDVFNTVENDKAVHLPTCRFCGRQIIPDKVYESDAAADDDATLHCDCYEATKYKDETEQKERRERNIKRLTQQLDDLSDYCERRSVSLNGDLYDHLLKTGIAVLDGVVESAQLKFARMRVSVSINSKSNLVIKFTYTDGATVEV